MFNFLKKRPHHFTFLTAMYESSHFSTSSPTLVFLYFFIFIIAIICGCGVVRVCSSLNTSDVEHIFKCLLTIPVSLQKCLLKSFANFYFGLFFFFLFGFDNSLNILDTRPYQKWFANFLPSYRLSFLIMSFDALTF